MELTRRVLWRVPLIALIAGFFYLPLCVRFLLAFGGTNPWAETLFHLLYLAVVLGAGWALFSGPAVNLGLPRSLYWLVTLLNAAVPLLFAPLGRKA